MKTIKEMKWSQTYRQKENEYEWKRNTFFLFCSFRSHVMMIIEWKINEKAKATTYTYTHLNVSHWPCCIQKKTLHEQKIS
jgi:hypothetical protein